MIAEDKVLEAVGIALTLFTVLVLPIVLWCRNHTRKIDTLTAMHEDPTSVFATQKTNQLLEKQAKALEQHMRQEEDMHKATINMIDKLNTTIMELTHYIRWSTEQSLGKTPPPFVRDANKDH